MKDSKFIELLNLYIDHQISPADAVLLEAEIQRNPERRKIYREYCQMQKACATLAETFRSDAPAGGNVVELQAGRRRMALATYAMGFAAAAACVALVFVNRSRFEQLGSAGPEISVTETGSAALNASTVAVSTASTDETRAVLQPAFAGVVRDDAPVETAVAQTDSVPMDWMHQVQLRRVTSEDLRFDMHPSLDVHDLTLRSARPYQGQVESTAFIYAK